MANIEEVIKRNAREIYFLQKEYDQMVFDAHGVEYADIVTKDSCRTFYTDRWWSALLDEVGELNHELKGDWCWWKKTQKPVDREKVLEELSDVWHFVVMKVVSTPLMRDSVSEEEAIEWFAYGLCEAAAFGIKFTPSCFLKRVLSSDNLLNLGYALGGLTTFCDFTLYTAFEAYKKKNIINRQRLKDGY